MVKVPLSNSFLERRDDRRKFSESLGTGASLAPRVRQRIPLGSENDWKFRLWSCRSWKASSVSLGGVVPTSINKYRVRYVGLGRDNLRSHFVFRPRHAPEWLHARFLPTVFLANEEEMIGKTFTTSLDTTNPNTYVKFIFLRTSPLNQVKLMWLPINEFLPRILTRCMFSTVSQGYIIGGNISMDWDFENGFRECISEIALQGRHLSCKNRQKISIRSLFAWASWNREIGTLWIR